MTIKSVVSTLFLSTLISSAYAASPAKDLCQNLPGFWVGEEHIVSEDLCKAFGGCTHMITVKIHHKGGSLYTFEDRWSNGQSIQTEGEIPFTCENGKVKLPTTEKYGFDVSCYSDKECFATISNPRFSAELVKH